jgi:N-acetylglucosamine-6-phosphate deacetylase
MTVLTHARVITPDGVLDGASVTVEDGVIAAIGDRQDGVDLNGDWLLPGFIDLHMHGGGGHDAAASPDDMVAAVAFHRQHGTTRTLISLVTAPLDDLARQLAWIADLADQDDAIAGAHLEGPFLSHARRGAHNSKHLRAPDRAALAGLIDAAAGSLRSVTLAPELPGATDVVRDVVDAGAVAAIGHSDATYAEACVAIEAGARLATHLFNGMRALHHREPGIIGAALHAGLACEVINDGIHVHPAITSLVAPNNLVLVTDAIDAAGVGDGEFRLSGQQVRVHNGEPRLDDGSLAGSTLTMDEAVRRAVLECGLSLEAASAGASANPARVLGIDDHFGRIAVGYAADLVVLDENLQLQRVMLAGEWS